MCMHIRGEPRPALETSNHRPRGAAGPDHTVGRRGRGGVAASCAARANREPRDGTGLVLLGSDSATDETGGTDGLTD